MDKSDKTKLTEENFDAPMEHIELESSTGRYRRDAIKDAQARAEAEALANNRRDLRISDDAFVACYITGDSPKKFSLFNRPKKCTVIDASISGIGIEAGKGLDKGDKITLTISDGRRGQVPEFEIIATVRYLRELEGKMFRYGLQYDQNPTTAYSDYINQETLKRKMEKVRERNQQ